MLFSNSYITRSLESKNRLLCCSQDRTSIIASVVVLFINIINMEELSNLIILFYITKFVCLIIITVCIYKTFQKLDKITNDLILLKRLFNENKVDLKYIKGKIDVKKFIKKINKYKDNKEVDVFNKPKFYKDKIDESTEHL